MKLTLDRDDLHTQYEDLSCSKIRYKHLKHSAQLAVDTVGRATFYTYDRKNYNVILQRSPSHGSDHTSRLH